MYGLASTGLGSLALTVIGLGTAAAGWLLTRYRRR